MFGDELRERQIGLIVVEGGGERLDVVTLRTTLRRDRGGVDATAQEHRYRNIRPKPYADGIAEQRFQFLKPLSSDLSRDRFRSFRKPIPPDIQPAATELKIMSSRQLADLFEDRCRRRDVAERQIQLHGGRIEFGPEPWNGKQLLQLGTECEPRTVPIVQEWFLANPVPGDEEPTVPLVPN